MRAVVPNPGLIRELKELETMVENIASRIHLLPRHERAEMARWVERVRREIAEAKGKVGLEGLGFIAVLAPVLAALAIAGMPIGIWLGVRKREAEARKAYLDCLEEHEKQGFTPEQAAEICKGKAGEIGISTLMLIIGGAAAVLFAWYLLSKRE